MWNSSRRWTTNRPFSLGHDVLRNAAIDIPAAPLFFAPLPFQYSFRRPGLLRLELPAQRKLAAPVPVDAPACHALTVAGGGDVDDGCPARQERRLQPAHLVFTPKYRRGVFDDAMLQRCEEIMRDVCTAFGAELPEFNGDSDHVHLLVHYPPAVALSRLVNSLKGPDLAHDRAVRLRVGR